MNNRFILTALLLLIGINTFAQKKEYRSKIQSIGIETNLIICKDGTLCMNAYNKVYRCEKGSSTWNEIDLQHSISYVENIAYTDGIFAVEAIDSDYQIIYLISDDEGKNWRKLDSGETKKAEDEVIFYSGGKVFTPFPDGHISVLSNQCKTQQCINPKYKNGIRESATGIYCHKNTTWIGTNRGHIYYSKNNFKKQGEIISPYYQELKEHKEDDETYVELTPLTETFSTADYYFTNFKRLKESTVVTPATIVDEISDDEIVVDTVCADEIPDDECQIVTVAEDEEFDYDTIVVDTVAIDDDYMELMNSGAYEAPEIRKFRIVGNYYIIKSGRYTNDDDIYITPKNKIHWEKVDSISWFDTTDTGRLMIVSDDYHVTLLDENLHPVWQQKLQIENDLFLKLALYGESLYSITDCADLIIYSKDGVTQKELFSNEKITPDDLVLEASDGKSYAYDFQNGICCRDSKDSDWYHIATCQYGITKIWERDGKVMVADFSDDKFEVDLQNNSLKKATAPKSLFTDRHIQEIEFDIKQFGCFHHIEFIKAYSLKGDSLVCIKDSITDKSSLDRPLANIPKAIASDKADRLIDLIEQAICHPEQEDFRISFSQEDKDEYLELMGLLFMKKGSWADEANKFLTDFADTIDTVPADSLRQLYSKGSGIYSTSQELFTVKLTMSDGTKHSICSNNTYQKYMLSPWKAIINNEPFSCPSVRLGECINELTGGAFIPYPFNTKAHAIYDIASKAYNLLHGIKE